MYCNAWLEVDCSPDLAMTISYLTVMLPQGQILDDPVLLKDGPDIIHIDGGSAGLGNDSVGDSVRVVI